MFDGNGNWTSDFSAQADRDNGIKILASRFDNIFIADIKESFENCLTKDGQIAPIGNFNMGGQKITNLNDGVNDNDAVNMSQLNNAVHNIFENNTWVPVGDDAYIGDHNQGGGVCIKGNNNVTGIYLYRRDETASNGFYLDENDNNGLKIINPTVGAVAWGSVTAMVGQNPSGYIKFNHGLIIQWGKSTATSSSGYVTLPAPFFFNKLCSYN